MLLDDFERWVTSKQDFFKEHKIAAEITRAAETENPAIWADLDSNKYVSRIIVRLSGFCDTHALSVETGDNVWYQDLTLSKAHEFDEAFKGFLLFLTED